MKSATALTVLAVGAVFAFAVTAHPSFVNFQVLGWVLMLTALTGLVIPRRGKGWLRRSVLVKGSPDFTETADADARKPAGGARVDRRVHREVAARPRRGPGQRGPGQRKPVSVGGWSAWPARGRVYAARHGRPGPVRVRQKRPSLLLARAAPHAVYLARRQGEVQALRLDKAASADHLRPIELLDRWSRRRQRKEQLRIGGQARALRAPVGICVHHRDQSSPACATRRSRRHRRHLRAWTSTSLPGIAALTHQPDAPRSGPPDAPRSGPPGGPRSGRVTSCAATARDWRRPAAPAW